MKRSQHSGRNIYHCTSGHVTRDLRQLDAYVSAALLARIGLLTEEELAAEPPQDDTLVDQRRKLEARIDDLIARKSVVTKQYLDGLLDLNSYDDAMQQAESLIDTAKAALHHLDPDEPEQDLPPPGTSLNEWWSRLGDNQRREHVEAHIDSIVIDKNPKGSSRRGGLIPETIDIRWR